MKQKKDGAKPILFLLALSQAELSLACPGLG